MMMLQVSDEIKLIPIEEKHAEEIFNIIDSQRDYLGEWLPFVQRTLKIETTLDFIRAQNDANDETYVITYNSAIAGIIGLKSIDIYDLKTEIGYWLAKEYQGKHIASRATGALTNYCFKKLMLNRVQIRVAVNNIKSRHIPERLGFKLEGIERDGEQLAPGVYTDIAVYSMLSRELP